MSLYQILHFQPSTVEFPVASPLLYLWLLISSKKQDANKLKILSLSLPLTTECLLGMAALVWLYK